MSRVKSSIEDELRCCHGGHLLSITWSQWFREAQKTIEKLQEEITSYQEIITIKDDVVMGLTNKLADLTENQQLTTETVSTETVDDSR